MCYRLISLSDIPFYSLQSSNLPPSSRLTERKVRTRSPLFDAIELDLYYNISRCLNVSYRTILEYQIILKKGAGRSFRTFSICFLKLSFLTLADPNLLPRQSGG